jgi:hypothetical protein
VTSKTKGLDTLSLDKTCKGINFWINKITTIKSNGHIIIIFRNQLWKGGTPNLNKIAQLKIKFIAAVKKSWQKRKETRKKIEAILWDKKYFIVSSLPKNESLELKIGKTEIMFISKLTQKKNKVWEENLNRILRKTIIMKPSMGDKNIINF